ncbi:MAG: hypothetical protein ABI068_07690 [Ktedonobacterales bacterium]
MDQPLATGDHRNRAAYPDDFSLEEARFTEELWARLTFAHGAVPPLYAQTLLGDDPGGDLAERRLAPLTGASERTLINRVLQALCIEAYPETCAAAPETLCEAHAMRSPC